jgi:hypothetical protein
MIEPDNTPVETSYTNGCFFNLDGVEYILHLQHAGPLPMVGKIVYDEVYRYGIARAHVPGYLETGKLRWNPINGPLTYREAQKSLITYWRTRVTPVELNELDKIVERCAFWMHTYFIADTEENTDYDIVRQYMDEEEWSVVLRPNYMANRLVEFHHRADTQAVEVHSYIEDNELAVKFP